MNPVQCSSVTKQICGSSDTTEEICVKNGCCYVDGLCYHDSEELAGFVKSFATMESENPVFVTSIFTVKECARKCLSYSNCTCFGYDFTTNVCQLDTQFCKPSNISSNSSYVYHKVASKLSTCRAIDCGGDVQIGSYTLKTCLDKCNNSGNCDSIVFNPFIEGNQCKLLTKDQKCIFQSTISKKNITSQTCIFGPVRKGIWNSNDEEVKNLTDSSNHTCTKVSKVKGFSLRIPWPSIDKENSDFEIRIIGENLEKCSRQFNDTSQTGIFVYNPSNTQFEINFVGDYKLCQSIDGDNNNWCTYKCTCSDYHCQSVYIKAYSLYQNNMKICEYKVLN